MSIKMGLDSTRILLTEVGRKWFTKHYPKGIIYEYDENGIFRLDSMYVIDLQAIAQIICLIGIPYRIPCEIDDQTTFRVVDRKEADG